jgi:hypothetical protein
VHEKKRGTVGNGVSYWVCAEKIQGEQTGETMIFIGLTVKMCTKAELLLQLKKGISHTCVNLPPLLSVEAIGVCIPTGYNEMFCAAVYKSPQRLWSDTDNRAIRF